MSASARLPLLPRLDEQAIVIPSAVPFARPARLCDQLQQRFVAVGLDAEQQLQRPADHVRLRFTPRARELFQPTIFVFREQDLHASHDGV